MPRSDSMKIHWRRVLIGAVLTEASIFATAVPVIVVLGMPTMLKVAPYTGAVGSLVMTFVFAVWVGRRVGSRHLLHGVLLAIAATILFVAGTLGTTLDWVHAFQHLLKVVGGAAGGLVAAKIANPSRVSSAHAQTA
jgi:hypothetical protein